MIRHYNISLLVLPIVFFWAVWCHAARMVPTTLEHMTVLSDAIVIGHVVERQSYWEDKKILTSLTVDVEQFVKDVDGGGSSSVEVIIPGGTVGDTTLEIDDAPIVEAGQKVMLFLKKDKAGYFPFGLKYGVYHISWDEESGKEFVEGHLLDQPKQNEPRTIQSFKNIRQTGKRDLAAFVGEVKRLVK